MRNVLSTFIIAFNIFFSGYSFSEKTSSFSIKLDVHSIPCNVSVQDVDFGVMDAQDINDVINQHKLDISPNCGLNPAKFLVKFDGNTTGVGVGLIATYDEKNKIRNDLGIKIEDAKGTINIFEVHQYTGPDFPEIYVRPFTNDINNLKKGTFNARATLSIWYE